MKNCIKCGKEFPSWITVDGKPRNLGNRKACLDCIPFKSGKSLRYETDYSEGKVCPQCHLKKPTDKFPTKADGRVYPWCRECNNNIRSRSWKIQIAFGRKRRIELIMSAGSACISCGYHKNYSVLSFHHKNPTTKEFELDNNNCAFHSWENLLMEAAKCDLLCTNCHGELHNPLSIINWWPY